MKSSLKEKKSIDQFLAARMNDNNNKKEKELDLKINKNNNQTNTTTLMVSPNTKQNTKVMNYSAIIDTAATGNYVTTECPVIDMKETSHGVDVSLPDGSIMTSTHTALLKLPAILPIGARKADIFPGLKAGSLISVGQLCDNGCKALFETTQVKIYYNDQVIMTGKRSSETNNLWLLEIDASLSTQDRTGDATIGTAYSLVAHDTIAERIAFYHAVLFSPVVSTWCDAIDNGHFTTWPELTSAQVRKHLPKGSVPMIKGHLHQQRSNIQSTKKVTISTEEIASVDNDKVVEDFLLVGG